MRGPIHAQLHGMKKTALFLVPFLAACTGYAGSEAGMQQNMLRGDLGNVSLEDTPELRELQVTDRGLFLDLRIIEEDSALMVGLTIPRRLNEAGELEFMPEYAEMIGCSGPQDDNWDIDCEPDDLIVNVVENDGSIAVDFEGTFHDCGAPPSDPGDPGDPGDDPGDPGDYPSDPPGVIDGNYLI